VKGANPIDFNALIPELATWNDGKGIDIDAWIERGGELRACHRICSAILAGVHSPR
jgi:hypothetical protein